MKKAYLHGDVVLREVGLLPKGAKKIEPEQRGYVLSEGEQTGHYHAIKELNGCGMYELDGVLYLDVETDKEIFHQEHKSKFSCVKTGVEVPLKKGVYEISFPQEYDHFEKMSRRVAD